MEEILKNLLKTDELTTVQSLLAKYVPNILVLLILLFIIKKFMNFIRPLIKKTRIPKNLHAFVASAIQTLLYFVLIVTVCSQLGIDITTLIATFSIVGVAVSLSIQSSLSNVMAGLTLLFTKEFSVDDYIEVADVSGTVLTIGLFNCALKTPDGKIIRVPNSTIISEKVTNFSAERFRRVDITIGTSYSEKVDVIKDALKKVVDDTPEIIKDKDIFIGITNFGESTIDYTIRVWVKNADYWNAYLPMLERIKRTFDERNIEIPFNQLDVHLIK